MSEREIPYAELRERMERAYIEVENKDAEIERLKDLLKRMTAKYEEEYGPFSETDDRECQSFKLVIEAREAVKQ